MDASVRRQVEAEAVRLIEQGDLSSLTRRSIREAIVRAVGPVEKGEANAIIDATWRRIECANRDRAPPRDRTATEDLRRTIKKCRLTAKARLPSRMRGAIDLDAHLRRVLIEHLGTSTPSSAQIKACARTQAIAEDMDGMEASNIVTSPRSRKSRFDLSAVDDE